MQMELDEGDAEIMRDVLDHTLRELRMEISQTDNHRWKKDLHHREDRIRAMLDQVGGPLERQR